MWIAAEGPDFEPDTRFVGPFITEKEANNFIEKQPKEFGYGWCAFPLEIPNGEV